MFVDLPLDQLRTYLPEVEEPDDFDAFWSDQLSAARAVGVDATFTEADTPIGTATTWDVEFGGGRGDRIKAWLTVPDQVPDDRPVIVEFVGYGGGRGHPLDWLRWPACGYPHLVMDNRGQGGSWRRSDTADPSGGGSPASAGFLTAGFESPAAHYYGRMFVDAVRAVDAAVSHPAVAGRPVVVTGASQGGALALAAGHLHPAVRAVMPDVPFLAHIRRGAEITAARPYSEIASFCSVNHDRADTLFRTLSYFDVVTHARRTTTPALFSVGLLDDITPASTVFTAYNHYAGAKRIEVYPFNGHEGGSTTQFLAQLHWLTGTDLRAETVDRLPTQ